MKKLKLNKLKDSTTEATLYVKLTSIFSAKELKEFRKQAGLLGKEFKKALL